jgi:ElaB/YqjD/DUF883 family membrane-anchored ribosome-binding protein
MATAPTDETKTREVDAIKQDIQQLRDDIGLLLGHIGTFGKEKLGDTRDKLNAAAGSLQGKAYDRLQGTTRGVSDQGRQAVDASRDSVQHRPLTYVAAAFVAGMIFASILGCKR